MPTVPGSIGLIKDEADAIAVTNQIGFPVMIKATAGVGEGGVCPGIMIKAPLVCACMWGGRVIMIIVLTVGGVWEAGGGPGT